REPALPKEAPRSDLKVIAPLRRLVIDFADDRIDRERRRVVAHHVLGFGVDLEVELVVRGQKVEAEIDIAGRPLRGRGRDRRDANHGLGLEGRRSGAGRDGELPGRRREDRPRQTLSRLELHIEVTRTRNVSTLLQSISTRPARSEEHTSELQSRENLVCRLLLEKKK